jgi:prevent-host-death family protein
MKQVNLYEAKTALSALVEAAAAGEEIIIAKNGKPKAKLVSLDHVANASSVSGIISAGSCPTTSMNPTRKSRRCSTATMGRERLSARHQRAVVAGTG